MKYQTFARTTLEGGENHKKYNKPCQDRSFKFSGEGMHIAVVADGHGSDNCFRSEYGAQFAVNAARKGINTFIKNLQGKELPLEDNFARQIKKLVGTIVDNWIYLVSEHYKLYPIAEEDKDYTTPEGKTEHFKGLKSFQVDDAYRDLYLKEAAGDTAGRGGLLADDERHVTRHAYGATLIAAAVTDDFWFGIQIGDGKLTAFYPDGSFDQPVPWDEKCYLNVTTSICDDDAAERARVYVKKRGGHAAAIDAIGAIKKIEDSRHLPSAIFLNSDGVDDSFPIEDNMDHMAKKFYYSVLRMFIENDDDPAKGWETAVKELADYLPELSKRGSGDDISVAGIIDMDAVKTEPFRAALQKAKVEAEERRAREKEEREKAIKAAEAARAEEAAQVAAQKAAQKAAEEAAREAAEEEAAAKKAAKAAKEKKPAANDGSVEIDQYGSMEDGSANRGAQRISPVSFQQSAADPLVQEKAKQLLQTQEAEKEAARKLKELRQEREKQTTELSEAVQLSLQKNTNEDDTDIPSSDAYKTKPQPGSKVDIPA